jgi:hypothetical protein
MSQIILRSELDPDPLFVSDKKHHFANITLQIRACQYDSQLLRSGCMPITIFLSYARQDFPFVEDILIYLKTKNINVFIDIVDLRVGNDWESQIEESIINSDFFIIALSPISLKSIPVTNELNIAIRHGKTILPILLQSCKYPSILSKTQWVDFRINFDVACRLLDRRINGTYYPDNQLILPTPRRSKYPFGITPIPQLPVPLPVRILLTIATFEWGYKSMIGVVVFINDNPPVDANVVSFKPIAFAALVTSIMTIYQSVQLMRRRTPFFTTIGVFISMLGIDIIYMVASIKSSAALLNPILFFVLAFDISMICSVFPKSIRRWAIAHHYKSMPWS